MGVDREGFGHEISAIEGARNEACTKQILACTITDPVKARVNALMAGLGTDDRRSAQPLAPREQLRFTYFLLWDMQREMPQANPSCPRTTFAQNKKFYPKNVFLGPGQPRAPLKALCFFNEIG